MPFSFRRRPSEDMSRDAVVWENELPLLNEADRVFFLSVYEAAVAHYQPRIERRTGYPLGPIGVRDFRDLHQDMVNEFRRRASPRAIGLVKSLLYRRRLRRGILQSKAVFGEEALKYPACYYRDAIYVSFESGTAHEEAIAALVVHELSHALWERIAGTRLDEERQQLRDANAEKHRLFAEGFATYGERAWFLDFYPASVRSFASWPLDPKSVYGKGFCRVKRLVQEHGPNILLEIPKQWREL